MNAFVKKIVDEIGAWANGKFLTAQDITGKYEKPEGGIPASDLASGVIPDISGKQDKSDNLTNLLNHTIVVNEDNGKFDFGCRAENEGPAMFVNGKRVAVDLTSDEIAKLKLLLLVITVVKDRDNGHHTIAIGHRHADKIDLLATDGEIFINNRTPVLN